MGKKKYLVSLVALSALALPFVYGCDGSKTRSGGRDDDSDVFVADENTSGRIELSVNSSSLPVGETSSFSALVYDANGMPVPNVNVICDSEKGIAIIEPARGFEMTDQYGHMSGVLGCEKPGSFQFMCRLPAGGAERKYVSIHCSGTGTASWGGTAGGGLGGDVASDAGKLRLTDIYFSDGDQDRTFDIDTGRACKTGCPYTCEDENEKEIWTSASIHLSVVNQSAEDVVFNALRYNVVGCSVPLSGTASLHADTPVGTGASTNIETLLIAADTKLGLDKQCSGLQRVELALYGTTDSGEPVVVEAAVTAKFTNFDRCKNKVTPSPTETASPNP